MKPEPTGNKRGGNPFSMSQVFTSLKSPAYRLYFFGMIGQMAPMSMQQMTNSLLIYDLTGSAILLGTLAIANGIPIFIFSLIGGVVADRFRKKHIMLISLGSQAAIAFFIAFALRNGFLSSQNEGSWWILIMTSFLQGTAMAFMMPAQQSIIPELVNEEQVTNAVALNAMEQTGLRLMAPAATGFIIAAFDFQAVFFIMSGLYLMGLTFVSFVPATGKAFGKAQNSLTNIKEGLRYIRHDNIILLVLFWHLCGMGTTQLFTRMMPMFSGGIVKFSDGMFVGEVGMGLWLTASGAGAILTSLTIASINPKRRGLVHVSGIIFQMTWMIVFAFSTSWPLSLSVVFFIGIGQTIGMTMTNALLQSYSQEEFRGRVFGLHMAEQGLASLVTFLVGLLASAVGAPWSIGTAGMLVIALGLMTLVFTPWYRRLA